MSNAQPQSDSQYGSEEKTEPFSSSEYAARLRALHVQESCVSSSGHVPVHLDELVVPPEKNIRLLVRPLRSRSVSPGDAACCEWVALPAELSGPDHVETVLAVRQTFKDIKFTVLIPGGEQHGGVQPLECDLYYNPTSDDQILSNTGDVPITLTRVSPSLDSPTSGGIEYRVIPGTAKTLSPGTWRIRTSGVEVLDFRILEKRKAAVRRLALPPATHSQDLTKTPNSSGKRTYEADADDIVGPSPQRQKTSDEPALQTEGYAVKPVTKDDRDKHSDRDDANQSRGTNSSDKDARDNDNNGEGAVIMFLHSTANPLVFPLPTTARDKEVGALTNGNALLDLGKGDTAEVPGSCELDAYQLTRHEPIASTTLSTVFTGTTDHPNIPAEGVITVKVIKTQPPFAHNLHGGAAATAATRPQEMEQNVILQANTWLREYRSHEDLQHNSIVRLYGGDARHFSLYMEHVEGRDLSSKGFWRAANSDYFTGDRQDATRILRDIAGALHYIHGRNLVHNDIKPANILYSRERGAVLCDFGLTTHMDNRLSPGGTPYYMPPEYIGRKLRGPPSDVWALGITMLYVLRKISFPDARRRHQVRPLFWLIADVNATPGGTVSRSAGGSGGSGGSGGAGTTGLSAVAQMQMWLAEINEAKEKLNREDRLERLTYDMLAANRTLRIPMHKVVKELLNDTAE